MISNGGLWQRGGSAISAQLLGSDGTQPDTTWIGSPVRATFIERGEEERRWAFLAFELET